MPNQQQDLASLIEKIKCDLQESNAFTPEELDILNDCLPLTPGKAYEIQSDLDGASNDPTADGKGKTKREFIDNLIDNANAIADGADGAAKELLQCISDIQDLADKSKAKSREAVRMSIVRAKLEEVYLNLKFLLPFYEARNDRFNELINGYNTSVSSNNVTDYLANAFTSISNFSGGVKEAITFSFTQYSPADVLKFNTDSPSINVPSLFSTEITQPDEPTETIYIYSNPNIDPTLFSTIPYLNLSFTQYDISKDKIHDFYEKDVAESFLYRRTSGYSGFYWKLLDPLKRMFTPEERGLTLDGKLTDPNLANFDSKTVKEGDITYFIANYDKFQEFYKSAVDKINEKIDFELNNQLPGAVQGLTTNIQNMAKAFADFLVLGETNLTDSTTVLSQGRDSSLYTFQLNQYTELKKRILLFESEIAKIKKKEKDTVSPEEFKKALTNIKCFPTQTEENNGGCTVMQHLGKDPLGMETVSGTNGGFPDITTYCYWLQFSLIMTMVNLMPMPDLSLTGGRIPGITFRYWPIGIQIPTPGPPIKIPLPQIWLPLVVISTPFGVMVLFLAICGMVPSPFLFFISSSGGKMYLASFKGLGTEELGFKVNDSGDPVLGLDFSDISGSKGSTIKGALQTPLMAIAAAEKASRIAGELARTVAKLPAQTLMPNGTAVPLNPGETAPPQYGQHEIMQKGVDKTKDFEDFVINTKTKIMKQIDEIGELEMKHVNPIKAKIKAGVSITPDQIAEAIAKEAGDAIGKLKLGSLTFPKDTGKLMIPPLAIQNILGNFKNEGSGGFKGVPPDFFDIKKLILKYITQLDLDLGSDTYDLKTKEGLQKFRKGLADANKKIFAGLQGNAKFKNGPDQHNSTTEAARVTKMLTVTFAFIAEAGAISLANPFRSCCKPSNGVSLPQNIAAPVALALLAAEKIMEAAILGISDVDLLKLAGGEKVISSQSLKNVIQSLLKAVPNMSLPKSLDVFNIGTLLSFISPVFAFLSLPQTPVLSVPGLPTQININLDNIVKPVMSKAVVSILSDAETLTKILPFDLIKRISEVSSPDIKAIIKQQINKAFDDIIAPTKPIFKIVDSIPSKKGVSKSILDTAFLPLNIKAEILGAVKAALPTSALTMVVNTTALAYIMKNVLPKLKPMFAFPLSFIIISALCTLPLGVGVMVARLLHPVYNQDDLPPWERLTITNPLLVIFIDEMISKGADSTGTILGRAIV